MVAAVNGPCASWATEADVPETLPTGLEVADVLAKIASASDLLWRWSGYQYPGTCSVVLRPIPVCESGPVAAPAGDGWWIPQGIGSTLAVNHLCGCSDDGRVLWLPGHPVTAITAVTIDGEVLDASAYRVEDFTYLVRQDGSTWPDQDRSDAEGWTVAYTFGLAPPASGVDAAVALAIELATAACPDCDCQLPENVRRASRNGLEYELSPQDFLGPDGSTGIRAVDFFIAAVNPNRLSQGSNVRSPDIDRGHVVTWP